MAKSNIHFSKLSEKEKISKLNNFSQTDGQLIIWLKGSSQKITYQKIDFDLSKLEFQIRPNGTDKIKDGEVLFSFIVNSVSFFGTGELSSLSEKIFNLACTKEIYKVERRETFRLLTYPTYQAYVYFKVDDVKMSTNIIELRTKMSQTALFKDFLKIVGDETSSLEKEGYLHFRINDLSVTGLSLQIGEFEKKFFTEGISTGKIFINFDGDEFSIKNSEIVYVIDSINPVTKGRSFKVGVKFLEVDIALDQKLGSLINKKLRDVEDEFEDFIN